MPVSCRLERLSGGSGLHCYLYPSLRGRRSDSSLLLTPGRISAGDPVSPCVAGQCH